MNDVVTELLDNNNALVPEYTEDTETTFYNSDYTNDLLIKFITTFVLGILILCCFVYKFTISQTLAKQKNVLNVPLKSRYEVFIEHQLANNQHVVFIKHTEDAIPFITLYKAIGIQLQVIDLAKTAQGSTICDALCLKYKALPSYLFYNGDLLGDYSQIRQMLLNESFFQTVGQINVHVDDFIHLDASIPLGFHVISPTNCFQKSTIIEDTSASAFHTQRYSYSIEEVLGLSLANATSCKFPIADAVANQNKRRSKLLVRHSVDINNQNEDLFYPWGIIDIFVCEDAENEITIPSMNFIRVGHAHRTLVLGNVHIFPSSLSLISTDESVNILVDRLVEIAKIYGFDGWKVSIDMIINLKPVEGEITNTLEQKNSIGLSFLTALKHNLHAQNGRDQSRVIWHSCRSRLDSFNAKWFDAADGLLTSYQWTVHDATNSASWDSKRRFDVYMGIECHQSDYRDKIYENTKPRNETLLKLAWNSGVSVGLYINQVNTNGMHLENSKWNCEYALWSGIGGVWKARQLYFDIAGGASCLYTSFNDGKGQGYYLNGQLVSSISWNKQIEFDSTCVLSLYSNVHLAKEWTAKLSHKTAFHGGSSIEIKGSICNPNIFENKNNYVKIMDTDMEIGAAGSTIEVSFVSKSSISNCSILLVLTVCPGLDGRQTHQLVLRSQNKNAHATTYILSQVAGIKTSKHFYYPVEQQDISTEGKTPWIRKSFKLDALRWIGKHIIEVGAICSWKKDTNDKLIEHPIQVNAYVGEICINGTSNSKKLVISQQPTCCQNARVIQFQRIDNNYINLKLTWDFETPSSEENNIRYVLVFAEFPNGGRDKIYVGKSYTQTLMVKQFECRKFTKSVIFSLVAISWCGHVANELKICKLHFSLM